MPTGSASLLGQRGIGARRERRPAGHRWLDRASERRALLHGTLTCRRYFYSKRTGGGRRRALSARDRLGKQRWWRCSCRDDPRTPSGSRWTSRVGRGSKRGLQYVCTMLAPEEAARHGSTQCLGPESQTPPNMVTDPRHCAASPCAISMPNRNCVQATVR